jgi:hypothetical protein
LSSSTVARTNGARRILRATTAGTPPPAGGSGPIGDGALATTGASVIGLGLVGLLLLAFGIGARTLGRRPA